MLVFHVIFKCKPGMRETFLEKLTEEGIVAACRGEAGNLGYSYYFSAENDRDLLLIEKWKDLAALAGHARQPHMARMDEIKAEYVTDMTLEKLEA
ncbi:MAG: antibiotic biosynthesis monooxygenase [Oscillospiraceae bacterium]|nr:antibiotic biosynthesis monooxygenase [Oscillospiraceae bacterium]